MNISSLHVCYIIKNFVETIYLSSTGPKKKRLLGDTVPQLCLSLYEKFCQYISALEKKCPVCLSLLDEEDEVKKMPCSHVFHSKCILPWLQKVGIDSY